MFSRNSQTIHRAVTIEGRGLHSDRPCKVTIHPSAEPMGLRFRRQGERSDVPALLDRVGDLSLATTLEQDGIRFATVEHLLAALSALGVDHAIIETDAEELPILDGSAALWVDAIMAAGLCEIPGTPRRSIRVLKPVEIQHQEKKIRVEPYPGLRLRYTIDFDHPSIGCQSREMTLTPDKFRRELASARTFCLERDIEFMRSKGLALGGSLDNAVVYGPQGPLNESLRFQDEAVRHKMLDLVGDLCLLGAPLQGLVTAHAAGHAMHVALGKALLADASAWTWCSVEPLKVIRPMVSQGLGQALPA